MWILFKNISRYVYQKKFSILGIMILLLIAITIFVTFGLLSTNLMNAYNNLIQRGNLANIVVDEDFKPDYVDSKTGQTIDPETEFETGLGNLGVAYRQFNSINITTTNSDLFKVIEYPNDATIDRLVVFNSASPLPEYDGEATLPMGTNFAQIIAGAQVYYTSSGVATPAVVSNLQSIVYEAADANWSNQVTYPKNLSMVCTYIANNPNYNPANYLGQTGTPLDDALADVSTYLKIWLDPNSPNYTPPITNGYRITFSLTNLPTNNLHIPILGYYSNFSSYLAVVSPAYIANNAKKIYPYKKFLQEINSSQSQMISQNEFTTYFDQISNSYKVYIDNVPYLIVGSGISPGFMYPIINFQNIIPNPKTQAIIYTNPQGYGRIQFSFPTSPTEDMMVCKYNGPKPLNTVVNDVNVLAHKYMAFPASMTLAYAYNNTNNSFSPTALRVSFITSLVISIRVVSVIISIFILVMSLIVIVLFTKKFIDDNQTIIAIMMANGINKFKVITSISFIGLIPAFMAGLGGFLIGFFTQGSMLGLFSTYWMIPTPTAAFNPGELFLSIFCTIILFVILTFLWSYFSLRKSVMEMMKAPTNFKMNPIMIFFKKWMDWAPTIVKFRFSIAFSSLGKILLLSVLSIISTVALLFISATANSFRDALALSQKTNHATFQVNLTTPTIDGGQYILENYTKQGQQIYTYPTDPNLPPSERTLINNLGYANGSVYQSVYNTIPLFREWSGMFWPSVDNLKQISTDLNFLKYHTSIQMLSDNRFGLGNVSSNPWLTTMAMIPANQANTSINLTKALVAQIMSNTEPLPWVSLIWNEQNGSFHDPFKLSSVGQSMFHEWVIGNIGVTNPNQWVDNDGSPTIGFINANQVSSFSGKTANQIAEMGASTVANDINNELYNAISPSLLNPDLITDLKVLNPETVAFQYAAPAGQDVITERSLFLKWFCEPETAGQNSLITYIDPFNPDAKYVPNNFNIMSVGESLRYSDSYILFMSHVLSNPLYQKNLYKFTYDSLIWNPNEDEPFTYVRGTIQNYDSLQTPFHAPKTIQINGIMPNSNLIFLRNAKGELINNLLFTKKNNAIPLGNGKTAPVYNLIPNAYAMKLYNLHPGQILAITPQNSIYRYDKSVEPSVVYYKIVGVSNTVHNATFWTSMTSAQQTIGLATATDYADHVNTPMNNMYNSFGGFNGIFTSAPAPFTLTKNIALYSPSGIYPGTSQFTLNSVFGKLVENTILTAQAGQWSGIDMLEKALYYTESQDTTLHEQIENALKDEQIQDGKTVIGADGINIAANLISALRSMYGSVIYNSIIEKPIAFQNMADMFNNLSSTIVKIKLMIAIIILVITLMMMFLLSWIMINDLIKIAALLKTQGYSDWSNALNFFSLFIPVWIFDAALTIPFTILVLHFYKAFIFSGVSVLISAPINPGYFVAIIAGLALIFFILFSMAFINLKRLNLIQVLKW